MYFCISILDIRNHKQLWEAKWNSLPHLEIKIPAFRSVSASQKQRSMLPEQVSKSDVCSNFRHQKSEVVGRSWFHKIMCNKTTKREDQSLWRPP